MNEEQGGLLMEQTCRMIRSVLLTSKGQSLSWSYLFLFYQLPTPPPHQGAGSNQFMFYPTPFQQGPASKLYLFYPPSKGQSLTSSHSTFLARASI